MDPKIEQLFFEALELGEEDRNQFLDLNCAGDPALRSQVEEMLADAGKADAYFHDHEDRTHGGVHEAVADGRDYSDSIGPYRLIREIGEGGFGVVWEAEQTKPIRRKVALKVIKAGMDTKEVLGRFEAERQALAMMDHPHIAKVFDAGETTAGRPYFAMELIGGQPIVAFCDTNRLGLRERLALFCDVCEAIASAHQKGIIHRDIKPSNILVTSEGGAPSVKVIDFGVAKAIEGKLTDYTLYTRVEQLIGTPAYMSPEQAGLGTTDLDTRSDIYGLGVLLYELLVGRPPFDPARLATAAYEEVRRIVREEEPTRPSNSLSSISGENRERVALCRAVLPLRLNCFVPSDLDWVVMKALEKDRERRYETTDAFRADIEAFLGDQPVAAQPPSSFYHFGKFAKRHRAALQIASAFVLLLLVATGLSLWLAVRATRAERTANERAQQAMLERQRAEAEANRASEAERLASMRLEEATAERDAKERALREAETISSFMADIFSSPDPLADTRKITVIETLDHAVARAETDLADDPSLQIKVLEMLAGTYERLGLKMETRQLRSRILELQSRRGDTADAGKIANLAALSRLHLDLGFYEDARRTATLELEARQQLPDEPYTIREARRILAEATFRCGEHEEGIKLQEEVVKEAVSLFGESSPLTARARYLLAEFIFGVGRWEEAMTLRASVAEQGKAPAASISEYKKRREITIAEAQAAVEAALKRYGPEDLKTLQAKMTHAEALRASSKAKEALEALEGVPESYERIFGRNHAFTLKARERQAYYTEHAMQGGPKRGNELRLEDFKRTQGQQSPEQVDRLLASYGLVQTPHETYVRLERVSGPKSMRRLIVMSRAALAYAALGNPVWFLKLYEPYARFRSDDTFMHHSLAGMQAWYEQDKAFEESRSRMIARTERIIDKPLRQPDWLDRIAMIVCLRPIPDPEVRELMVRAIERSREMYDAGLGSDAVANFQNNEVFHLGAKALVEYRNGEFAAALETLAEAERISEAENVKGAMNFTHSTLLALRALCLHALGKPNEAKSVYREMRGRFKEWPQEKGPGFRCGTFFGLIHMQWVICREAARVIDPENAPDPVPSPEEVARQLERIDVDNDPWPPMTKAE